MTHQTVKAFFEMLFVLIKPLVFIGLMEAAIGIEPMNKGFAEFVGDFVCGCPSNLRFSSALV